jgi:hypothetical protein
MKLPLIVWCGTLSVAAGATSLAAESPSLTPDQAIAVAITAAKANHVHLPDYQKPMPSLMDNHTWFVFFRPNPRYGQENGKRVPVYLPDDCFWVTVGATRKAEFTPCG